MLAKQSFYSYCMKYFLGISKIITRHAQGDFLFVNVFIKCGMTTWFIRETLHTSIITAECNILAESSFVKTSEDMTDEAHWVVKGVTDW